MFPHFLEEMPKVASSTTIWLLSQPTGHMLIPPEVVLDFVLAVSLCNYEALFKSNQDTTSKIRIYYLAYAIYA